LLTTAVRLETTAPERPVSDGIAPERNPFGDKTMRGMLQLALAIGVAFSAPTRAQTNSTIGPSTDHSVTTGIGSSSTLKNVPPPERPVPGIAMPLPVVPDTQQKPAEENDGRDRNASGNASPPTPPPAAEVKEDPRTMITRDRIESPQH